MKNTNITLPPDIPVLVGKLSEPMLLFVDITDGSRRGLRSKYTFPIASLAE